MSTLLARRICSCAIPAPDSKRHRSVAQPATTLRLNRPAARPGEIRIIDMVRTGIILNLIGIALITLLVYLLGTAVFGIEPGQLPDWALDHHE